MDLDDLLALLPDNTTGAIDASDLRTIVTELYERIENTESRVAALEASGSSGDEYTISGVWQVNPTAGATPGGSQVTCDTGLFSTATWLRFATSDKNDLDATAALANATSIYAQQKMNAQNWARYTVSGSPTIGSGYIEVPVTVEAHSGTVGAAAWQDAVAVIKADVT